MYSEVRMMLPYLQDLGFLQGGHHSSSSLQLQEEELLYRLQNSIMIDGGCDSGQQQDHLPIIGSSSLSNLVATSTVSEYDLGAEGDLFKAPEPIIEEPVLTLDHVTAAISMISGGEDLIAGEAIKAAEIDPIENDHLLSEVFYECKKDLLAKTAAEEEPLQEAQDMNIPTLQIEGDSTTERDKLGAEGPLQKSVSSGCLLSNDWINNGGTTTRPNFLDFQQIDLGAAFGMRRAYSEGDMQTLGNGSVNVVVDASVVHPPPFKQMPAMDKYKIEERKQKLSRYRKKKSERNFGRKIKYACRKALADSQPRVRGRFAKTDECDIPRPTK